MKNKVAVVTGFGGAIGTALSEALEKEGVTCVNIGKDHGVKCDFTNPEEVAGLAQKIAGENPTIDYLFNVAGIGVYKNIEDISVEEWDNSFAINVDAPFILAKKLLTSLKNSGDGLVFNVGSGMGVFTEEDRPAYSASKFALRGLSLSLSKDLKKVGIDVCLLTLGSVMTPFGTGGIDKRMKLEREGKKYLSVEEVVAKIMAITKSERRENEYTMYPEGYI